ncbi:MAG: type II toxin-antitoxin system VapC family toxin [Rhodocyclaceae bacterium]|jgi:PIN domain nuclease of toxin-antitoxin system|nr:type II toxin-antitoxin system VapC family toxin [Rhodocyclaceae bacterium]
MKLPLLLDTHAWIWWLLGQSELSVREREALDALAAAGTPPALSAISLWEAQMLAAKERLTLDTPLSLWLPVAAEAVTLLPLDVSVVVALDRLPAGFHGDPADRIIVATARAHGLPLLTRDGNIRRSRAVKLWQHAGMAGRREGRK